MPNAPRCPTPCDAQRLDDRNILYAPDYVISIGGAMSAMSQELEGLSQAETYQRITSVEQILTTIFTTAHTKNITPDTAAHHLAEARLGRQKDERMKGKTKQLRANQPIPDLDDELRNGKRGEPEPLPDRPGSLP